MSSMKYCGLIVALALVLPVSRAQEIDWREIETRDGTDLTFGVVLPTGFDAAKTWPLALALPPGAQDRSMVEVGFARYWGETCSKRGWVVVSPVAPQGKTFASGGEAYLAELLVHLRQTFRIEGQRIHLLGASNGGRSALRIATMRPFEFGTLTVLPGFAAKEDMSRLYGLQDMTVTMFAGGKDVQWVTQMNTTADKLRELGVAVTTKVFENEGHVPAGLDGDVIPDLLDSLRAKAATLTGDAKDVAAAIDDFHDAAAKADGKRYFDAFAPEGIFLGTDGTERWTVEEFKKWSEAYFKRKSAWIFVPQRRGIHVAGDVAWFDEKVTSSSYGECRGSGVMRRIGGVWKVAQYNLTFAVPNDIADSVVGVIRAFEWRKDAAPTVVWLCRHAEKAADPGDGNPSLSDAGRARAAALAATLVDVKFAAIYTSQFKRNQETVLEVAKASAVEPVAVDADHSSTLLERIARDHAGQNVLISGHSNTVPELIKALGVTEDVKLTDGDYDDLFAVIKEATGKSRLVRLHYGAPTP